MAIHARYLFDTDFAAPPAPAEPAEPPVPMMPVHDHEALLAAAVDAARAEGRADGIAAAEAEAARRLADEAARLAAAAQSMLAILDGERARIEADAMALAEAVGRAIAGQVIAAAPHQAVLAVVSEAMEPLRKAPHVVIRLSPDDVEALGEPLRQAARERGFDGRMVLIGEPGVSAGDCRIEWADGGIVSDRAAREAAVATLVQAHIAQLAGPAAGQPGEDA